MKWILCGFAYLWFGWHYADAIARKLGMAKHRWAFIGIGLLAFFWPLLLVMRVATKLAEW